MQENFNEEENLTKKHFQIDVVQLKAKKRFKPFAKLRSDILKNSRIFHKESKKIDEKELVESAVKIAEEKNEKKPSKKKKVWNIAFFIFNLALIVFVFYNFATEQEGGFQPLSTLINNNPKWIYLLISVGLFFLANIFNALKFLILIYSRTKKFRPWFSLKIAIIGRYYDHVTPLGSGGQPFEIYYLKKNGYSGDEATAIPLAKYMSWQLMFMLLGLYILIAHQKAYISSTLVLVMAWVGLGIILLLFLFVLFMSITKKWGAGVVVGVLKLLNKMHIIKDYKAALRKVLHFVKSYQYSIKMFIKSPFTVLSLLVVQLASQICNCIVAYFVYISFVEVPVVGWWEIVCKCCICEMAVAIVPLPGGTGATELSFDSLLGSLFPAGTLFWGILIWRILTYYLYIPLGIFIMVWDIIASRRAEKKSKPGKNINIENIPNEAKKQA